MKAEQANRTGAFDEAQVLYREAAEYERLALFAIDPAKQRTRGITAVSAVSLFYKAVSFEEAEQLAYSMLADSHIPTFAKVDLRNLVQAIWTEASKTAAKVNFLPGQVFVSVRGGEVITGGAPLDLVVAKVQTIQSIFYRTIEFLRDMPLRSGGGPSQDIQEACRPWLFQSAPGSYQFSVAIQQPKQMDFFKEDVRPEMVARQFLEIIRATSSEDKEDLAAIVPKADYRDVFLKLSRNLAPTGKSFESIEFRTATGERRVALTPNDRAVINKSLKKPSRTGQGQGNEEELRGVLRAVDLNRDFLSIMVNGEPVNVLGLEDAMDDVIGPMVNKNVRATVLRAKGRLQFRDIELED